MIGQYVAFAQRHPILLGKNKALTNHDKDDVMFMSSVIEAYCAKGRWLKAPCVPCHDAWSVSKPQ